MRVAWWAGWLPLGRPYGEALHYLESTRALLLAGVEGSWLLTGRESSEDLGALRQRGIPTAAPRLPFPPRRLARMLSLPRHAWMWDGADVLHAWRADFVPPFAGPTVITVLDALLGSDGSAGIEAVLTTARRAAARAQAVLTSTESTVPAIESVLRVPRERVTVVGAGVDLDVFHPGPVAADAGVLERHGLAPGYVLYTGGWAPRKGLSVLAESYASLDPATRPRLVLTGDPGQEAAVAVELVNNGARTLGYVPDGDLPALVRQAAALVMPSLAEGFGLPVLQAMACDRPVIASDIPVLREVTRGLVALVVPGDAARLAERLSRAAGMEPVAGALEVARAQSWAAGAQRILNVYRRVVD